jgi:hypothetical protein
MIDNSIKDEVIPQTKHHIRVSVSPAHCSLSVCALSQRSGKKGEGGTTIGRS